MTAHLTQLTFRPFRALAFLAILCLCVLGLTGCQPESTEPEASGPSATQAESHPESQTTAEAASPSTAPATSPETEKPSSSEADSATLSTTAEASSSSAATEPGEIQELKFSEMYEVGNSSRGLRFSEHFKSLDGQKVKMNGFMAPPLKPVFNFFVLSKEPMAICPFCSSDADWPADIVAVYVEKGTKSVSNDSLLTIIGRLELGSFTDEETGFVSQARIFAEEIIHNR